MSARFMRRAAASVVVAAAALNAFGGEIILFEDVDFHGNSMRITSEVASLDGTGMNPLRAVGDRARRRVGSMSGREFQWRMHPDASGSLFSYGRQLRAQCLVRPRSRLSVLGGVTRRLMSVLSRRNPQRAGQERCCMRATIFRALVPDVAQRREQSRPDRVQRSSRFATSHEAATGSFAATPTSRANAERLVPEIYPNLPRELDGRISSGRQISSAYPYSTPPQWDRR